MRYFAIIYLGYGAQVCQELTGDVPAVLETQRANPRNCLTTYQSGSPEGLESNAMTPLFSSGAACVAAVLDENSVMLWHKYEGTKHPKYTAQYWADVYQTIFFNSGQAPTNIKA